MTRRKGTVQRRGNSLRIGVYVDGRHYFESLPAGATMAAAEALLRKRLRQIEAGEWKPPVAKPGRRKIAQRGHIELRGNAIRIHYRDAYGQKVQETMPRGTTYLEAAQWLQRRLAEIETKKWTPPIPKSRRTIRRGWFYMVQLWPEAMPGRIKLGWSVWPERRLREHRTNCPEAQLVGMWRCLRKDEMSAIGELVKDCTRSGPEVVDVPDLAALVKAAADHFGSLPVYVDSERIG